MRRAVRRWPWVVVALAGLLVAAWLVLRVPDIPVATLRAKYGSPASWYVEVLPGLTVHLRDEGKGDGLPLVLLHGSNASLHTWEPWVARLGSRYRIVSFDFPAHGLTGPAPDGQYTAAAYAKVVDAVVANRGLTHFVLAGNSMGGGVAARYAADHPERIAGLILIDAGGQPMKGDRDIPLAFRIADTPILRDVVAGITPRWLVADGVRGAVAVKSVMTEPVIDRYWELLRYPGSRAATLQRFRQGYGTVSPADLGRISAPALILWGREDRFIPVTSAAYFGRYLARSRTVIYDRVGHLPMEETPDRSAADVATFLAALPVTPQGSAPSPTHPPR